MSRNGSWFWAAGIMDKAEDPRWAVGKGGRGRRACVGPLAVLVAVVSVSVGAARVGATEYSVTEIPMPDWAYALALNSSGQVLAGGHSKGYFWDGTTTWILRPPGSDDCNGCTVHFFGMNDAGAVVGTVRGEQDRAFLWQGGVMTDLGALWVGRSYANGINNAGQVVGYASAAPGVPPNPFLWDDGVTRDLGTLGGIGGAAWGINDSGQIVGAAGTEDQESHAFLWSDGVMTDLGTLGGKSVAVAINNEGTVVGNSQTPDGVFHAFCWSDGVMTDLLIFVFLT